MSEGRRQSQSDSQHRSNSKTKTAKDAAGESNQNFSNNANCPSSDSKRRFSNEATNGFKANAVSEFRASEPPLPRASYETQVIDGVHYFGRLSSNGARLSHHAANQHTGGVDASTVTTHERQKAQQEERRHKTSPSSNPNSNASHKANSKSNASKPPKQLVAVHYQEKLGPVESDKMEEDEDVKFVPIADSNQRSIEEYLSKDLHSIETRPTQNILDDLLRFCDRYFRTNEITAEQFFEAMSPYVLIQKPYPASSRGGVIGDHLVTNGLFYLAYGKYLVGAKDRQKLFYNINVLQQFVETNTKEFEEVWQELGQEVSLSRHIQTSEKRQRALRASQKEALRREREKSGTAIESLNAEPGNSHQNRSKRGSEGTELSMFKQGSQANYPQSQTSPKRAQEQDSGVDSPMVFSKNKKVPKKRKKPAQKIEQDHQHLGMAYTHKIINDEIVLVKKSLRKHSPRKSGDEHQPMSQQEMSSSRNRSHHQYLSQPTEEPTNKSPLRRSGRKSRSKKVQDITEDNVEDIIKNLDQYKYKPKFDVITDNCQPLSQEDRLLHAALQRRQQRERENGTDEASEQSGNSQNKDSNSQAQQPQIKTPPSHKPLSQEDDYSHKSRRSWRRDRPKDSPPKHELQQERAATEQEQIELGDCPQERQSAEIKRKWDEFQATKHQYRINEFIEPVVEVIDPNIDNLGIYAVVKLDQFTAYELREQYAVVPLPTFPKRDIDIERRQLIHETLIRCKHLVNRMGIAWIARTPGVNRQIQIAQELRRKKRRMSEDNFKITPQMVESPDIDFLNRPMNKYPSKQCKFTQTEFKYDEHGNLLEVVAPGCEPARRSKHRPNPSLRSRHGTPSNPSGFEPGSND